MSEAQQNDRGARMRGPINEAMAHGCSIVRLVAEHEDDGSTYLFGADEQAVFIAHAGCSEDYKDDDEFRYERIDVVGRAALEALRAAIDDALKARPQ